MPMMPSFVRPYNYTKNEQLKETNFHFNFIWRAIYLFLFTINMLIMVTGRHHITWGKLKTHIFILLGNSPYGGGGGGGVRKGSPWTGYM